ncbi:TetR/AcrR family transcriptional regulator [Actinokineospora globicatena]|uniref:TetR/AcrR family transcriptional regulator n=1 Tax=Actinokineospora globicatena TaxID=103729 RepID=UPI0020A36157|nr:TetR family transcriptional regulator [Actinokineospora globicatena]MCP2301280.1 transcriptional regulator, TetR family [Actinokineospora globicatena]
MQVTVTEAARRAQITGAATEVIARDGYPRASYARIVEHAGLSSTRLISYHFRDKNDLVMAVLIAAIGAVDERMTARLDGVTDRVEMLRGYIESQVGLLRSHPDEVLAIREIAQNLPDLAPVLEDFRVGRLARQLTQGQREGVFAPFDVRVMARTIASGIDGADSEDYGRELADLFVRACVG